MAIPIQCQCGRRLTARDEFNGARARCPTCGRILHLVRSSDVPDGNPAEPTPLTDFESTGPAATAVHSDDSVNDDEPESLPITEFLDPPTAEIPPPEPKRSPLTLSSMLQALLDPRSIHWMLMFGGGLLVIGALIWLVSLGVFKDPKMIAVLLGAGSLGVLATGWWTCLKTRFKTAGQALTFLGCVVCPLNLWFYDSQGLVTIDQHLWVGGVICCLLYAVTVFVLRDPLFLYAVEAGVTLTILLLLANLQKISDTTSLCFYLAGAGLISIFLERAFSPSAENHFNRQRFGLPLFWSGQAQMGVGLTILFGTQIAGWLFTAERHLFDITWSGNLLTGSALVAGTVWFAGAAAYLYSDMVVRKIGVYTYLAAFCLLMGEFTVVGDQLQAEGAISVLAVTAVLANIVHNRQSTGDSRLARTIAPLAMILSMLPLVVGFCLHLRATSVSAGELFTRYDSGWGFVGAMVCVAVCSRISAFLVRKGNADYLAGYFFLSAGAVILAAAGLLRQFEMRVWLEQAPLLLLIPIAYLIAARLWMGHAPERPLKMVAHVATWLIMFHGILEISNTSSLSARLGGGILKLFSPIQGHRDNLLLGLVFSEAALFYVLAGVFHRRGRHVYLAALAACGALWQYIGYWGQIDSAYYTILYAVLGIMVLAAGRILGLEEHLVYDEEGKRGSGMQGRGLPLFQAGNSIVTVALLAALIRGLTQAATDQATWLSLTSLGLTTGISFCAIGIVPFGGWRRFYTTASLALTGICLLTLNVLSDLSLAQKLEIFLVLIGLILLVVSSIARFRESPEKVDDSVGVGLFVGSFLATFPLLIAFGYYRFGVDQIHWPDELALVAITLLLITAGVAWQMRSPTVLGGLTLGFYLLVTLGQLVYRPQVATGVYLAIGGALIFGMGLLLSIFRERLLKLPDQIAKREGMFKVLQWR